LGKSANNKSGDGSVPYSSLSWCNTWHADYTKVKVANDSQENNNLSWAKIIAPATDAFIYRYESNHKVGNITRKTVVVEFDNVNHRNIIKSAQFISLLVKELLSAKSKEEIQETIKEAKDRADNI